MPPTDDERIRFLDGCAAAMRNATGLEFAPFAPRDNVRNRHAWLPEFAGTGCGVVAYQDGAISVHLYSDRENVVDNLKAIAESVSAGDFPNLPGHMTQRLGCRSAPRNERKVYLEFRWRLDKPLEGVLPDVETAARFFHSIRGALG